MGLGGFGLSESNSTSIQESYAQLTQQFSNTCNINCQNTIQEAGIEIIDTNVQGDVEINQACFVDGTCTVNNNMDAVADTSFSASNTTNANDASSVVSADFDFSNIYSLQSIRNIVNQAAMNSCNVSALNEMSNVVILAEGANIGGNVEINQTGSAQGGCVANNMMNIAVTSTGLLQNSATSGKDLSGQISGGAAGIGILIALVVVGLIIFYVISKVIANKSAGKTGAKGELPAASKSSWWSRFKAKFHKSP